MTSSTILFNHPSGGQEMFIPIALGLFFVLHVVMAGTGASLAFGIVIVYGAIPVPKAFNRIVIGADTADGFVSHFTLRGA